MSNPRVENWTQSGRLYLWRYGQNTKNYPGWNLAADETGWQSIADLLERMAESTRDSRREISVSRPTALALSVPNNPVGSKELESKQSLILNVQRNEVADQHWKLESSASRVILELGTAQLGVLHAAVLAVQRTGGDFAIGPDDKATWKESSLWFWLIPKV
jgi:hypothetical protein